MLTKTITAHLILVVAVTISSLRFTLAAALSPQSTTSATPQAVASLNYTNASQYIAKVSIGNFYYYQCSPNPCQNGGYCSTNGHTISCSCQAGFSGGNCQFYNLANTCLYNSCPGGSVCTLQSNGYYSCQCPAGYYGPLCLSSSYLRILNKLLFNFL